VRRLGRGAGRNRGLPAIAVEEARHPAAVREIAFGTCRRVEAIRSPPLGRKGQKTWGRHGFSGDPPPHLTSPRPGAEGKRASRAAASPNAIALISNFWTVQPATATV
jgi:hypothetical protein